MRTHRFGRKLKLPSTIAIKHQIRMLMVEDAPKLKNLEARGAESGGGRETKGEAPPIALAGSDLAFMPFANSPDRIPAEEVILECLGAAVIMRWSALPTKIQRELFEHATSLVDFTRTAQLKRQVACFLHNRKDVGFRANGAHGAQANRGE